MAIGRVHLELPERSPQRVGIVTGLELATSFQDADARPFLGEASGGDGAAIAGADYDDIVVRLQLAEWHGQTRAPPEIAPLPAVCRTSHRCRNLVTMALKAWGRSSCGR